MANGTWKRTTTAERRAARRGRYAHVSVNVGAEKDPITGILMPTRTPRGEGSTATRLTPRTNKRGRAYEPKRRGHDWPGAYLGIAASKEVIKRARRKVNQLARRPLSQLLQEALQI